MCRNWVPSIGKREGTGKEAKNNAIGGGTLKEENGGKE